MTPRAQRLLLRRLEREYGPQVRRAFERSVREWRASINLADVTRMIDAGNIDGVLTALGVGAAVYRDLEAEIARTFERAGRAFSSLLPKNLRGPDGLVVRFGFDMRHRQAEFFLRHHAAGLVTRMAEEDRAIARGFLSEAMRSRGTPRTVALQLAGRINRATGIREGGIIGLSGPQSEYLRNARGYLAAGDSRYFGLTLRDKRFDGAIRRAMAGNGVPPDTVEKALTQYSNRMLAARGRTIAETETLTALEAGKHQSMQQAIDSGAIPDRFVKKRWRHSGKANEREDHLAFGGTEAEWGEPFVLPSGARMMHPRDASLGAGASDIVKCYAPWVPISPIGLQRSIARRYCGELVHLSIGGEVDLAVTPNHPVLTQRGWLRADLVVEGDYLVECSSLGLPIEAARQPEIGDAYPTAEQLHNAAQALGYTVRAPRADVNLHGERPDEDVDVVTVNDGLRGRLQALSLKVFGDLSLADTDIAQGRRTLRRLVGSGRGALANPHRGSVGGLRPGDPRLGRIKSSATTGAFRPVGRLKAHILEASRHFGTTNADGARNTKNGVSGIEKSANFGVVFLSLLADLLGAPRDCLLAGILSLGTREVQIGEALVDERDASADLVGHARRRVVHGAQFANSGPEWLTRLARRLRNCLAVRADDAGLFYHLGGERRGDADVLTGLTSGHAGHVSGHHQPRGNFTLRRVTNIETTRHEGLVYSFETSTGLILSAGVVSHNCGCTAEQVIDFIGLRAEQRQREVA